MYKMPGKVVHFGEKYQVLGYLAIYHQGLKTNMQLFLWMVFIWQKACILICCDEPRIRMVSMSGVRTFWGMEALMARIATPGNLLFLMEQWFSEGYEKSGKRPDFNDVSSCAFCQVRKRYTTLRPKTLAGMEL